jgi:tetratricopeptide (TPR) repeat protein
VVPGTPRALEAICLKALSKLPAERYGSAADLASELRHYLADEPVTAYREPVAALAGRWVRRHRTFVAGSAVLIVTLLAASAAGLLLLGQKNREIAAERNAARAAADQARAVNDFLTEDLLGQADPDLNDRDQKITVEALLHRAAVKLDQSSTFAGQPEVEATLRMTLGKTLFKLSDLAGAEVHLRRAVELRHEALGPNDPLTLTAREALADFLNRGPGRFDESLTLSRETWEARSRVLGPEHRDTLDSLDTYATALMASGRLDEAIPFQRQCLEARRSVLGPTHAETLTSMSNLATTLMKRGVWSEAIPLLQEVLAARSSSNSESRLAVTASNLAICLYMNGDLEEANRLLSDALGRVGQPLGDHQETDRLRWLQVRVWIDQGRTEEAIALALEALPLRRRIYPAGNSMIGQALMDRGRGLVILKQFVEAETDLTESLAIFAKAAPFLPHFPGWAECWLGASLAGQGRHTEAERHLLAAEKKLREAPTTPRRHYVMCAEQLVKLYESWGKPDQAAKWRDLLTPAGGKSSKSP